MCLYSLRENDHRIADRSFDGILLPKEPIDGADGGIAELRGEELRRKRSSTLRFLGHGAIKAVYLDRIEISRVGK